MVPIPSGQEEKRGPGRPPGSGSKSKGSKSSESDDSLAQLITAGVQMLAAVAVQKRGPHWSGLLEKAQEIGELSAKVIDKYFPASKVTKFADEGRLLMAIGTAVGPALMVEWMAAQQQQAQEKEAKERAAGGQQAAGPARSDGPSAKGPGDRPAERREQSDGLYGVRDDLPALVQ